MYFIIMQYECGQYRFMAKTTLSITARINEIMNQVRSEYCTHQLLSVIVVPSLKKRYTSNYLYLGNCSFGN